MSSGNKQPRSLRIRSYQVGFGDCFLLTFQYAAFKRHILIDFGSMARPIGAPTMDVIAKQIRDDCDGNLDAVVATHRHKDHISGFATRADGQGTGNIIASCEPAVVVQPWTENPNLGRNARGPTLSHSFRLNAFITSRAAMQEFALATLNFIETAPFAAPRQRRLLQFLGENNITNRSAVENLMRMGRKHIYSYYGSRSGLESRLPGVTVDVLGPPTLMQSDAIRHQQAMSPSEYWHMRAQALYLGTPRRTAAQTKIFPNAESFRSFPIPSRWLVERLQQQRTDEIFELVRILDDHMNNTSLILLFRVGSIGILFPGDAQFENWSYALSQPRVRRLLRSVQVYKVGHHGSLNGTPKSLWHLFERRGTRRQAGRIISLNSTMPGIHGFIDNNTEVPRRTLVKALTQETRYVSTQNLKRNETYLDQELVF